MSDVPPALTDEMLFLDALKQAGGTVNKTRCTCPFHEDTTPSAQWSKGHDGTWRMFCHVCARHANTADLIAHATGRDSKTVFKEMASQAKQTTQHGTLTRVESLKSVHEEEKCASDALVLTDKAAVVAYTKRLGTVQAWHRYGPSDSPTLVVARIMQASGKKTFRQFTPVAGGWSPQNTIERGTIPLYRVDELGDRVLVVEGEKAADAAWAFGIHATTSAMGAGKAAESNWTPLKNKKIYLWPDNDPIDAKTGKSTGHEHMKQVRAILEGIGCTVFWIDPTDMGLPPKGDVADLIDALDSKSKDEVAMTINGIMDDAEPQGASAELAGLLDDIAAGKYVAIHWPDLARVGSMSKALLPGCITTLCAEPGAGKSLIMLQMLKAWSDAGEKVALLALEDERRIHLQRIMAQTAQRSCLVDDEWCRNNTTQVRNIFDRLKDVIDSIGANIRAESDRQMTLSDIGDWIETRAQSGVRIIIADPVTAAVTEKEPWAADTAFLMRVKSIARKYGTSVVLVTHPRGQSKGSSLSGMAGGSAYPRFSHCALWLEKFDMQERRGFDGGIVTCNRSIKIIKSRHGKGGGLTIGVLFDSETLRFRDCGALAPEYKSSARIAALPSTRSAKLRADPSASEDLFNEPSSQ